MVKFGRHQRFFVEENEFALQKEHAFVVPYNDAKSKYIEDATRASQFTRQDFVQQVHQWTREAQHEFDTSLEKQWHQVFSQLAVLDPAQEWRGAPPEKALVLLCQLCPSFEDCSQRKQVEDLLDAFKLIHETSLLNAEALRKLVKKYDKHFYHQQNTSNTNDNSKEQNNLTFQLMPQIYASNFVTGLFTLQHWVDLLRQELGLGEYASTAQTTTSTMPTSPVVTQAPTHSVSPHTTHASTTFSNHDKSSNHFERALEDHLTLASGVTNTNADMTTDTTSCTTNTTTPSTITTKAQKLIQAQNEQEHKPFTMLSRNNSNDMHQQSVYNRRQEYYWLQHAIQRISSSKQHNNLAQHLVAHRGFHSPSDRSDKRPLENSLQAYEMAWTAGIHLCECDIALTKDEHLILAHDEDFSRLALDATHSHSTKKVRDLTLRQIMSVALTSGVRPPLLMDVLQSAHAIGGTAQLIIEIKPGNREAATALAKLFAHHPHLMAHCAVVMSFDSFAMHSLQDEMDLVFGTEHPRNNNTSPQNASLKDSSSHNSLRPRSYSLGLSLSQTSLAAMNSHQNLASMVHHQYPILPISPLASHASLASSSKQHQPQFSRPKMIVLTVSDTPQIDVELQLSVLDSDAHDKINHWTKNGRLSGVYMHFETSMLEAKGSAALQALANNGVDVGIWGFNGTDPDDFETFRKLVLEGNVKYVNTDLPRDFFGPNEFHGAGGNTWQRYTVL